jgi:heme oxygenase (biliverdin-IX-beta and delta-forming)
VITLPEPNSTNRSEASARAFLFHATRVAHDRLEGQLPLNSPRLTLDEYKTTIHRLLGIYTVLEAQIETHLPMLERFGFEWPRRRKLHLLKRDVAVLSGAAPGDAFCTPPPGPDAVPHLATFFHVVGCMYVMEGATLGGKLISRNVERTLLIGPDSGASFFDCYGPTAGALWQAFCAALEPCLADGPARSAAAVGATATFRLFVDQLAPRKH